jgi:2-aminoadipate transaminase
MAPAAMAELHQGTIILSSGYAAPEAFPGAELAELAADILRHQSAEALQYSSRNGYDPLRRRVAEWLTADGVVASADEILIVTGAKQGLDMAARALTSPGDTFIASQPTYMNGLTILRHGGLRGESVPHDPNGMDVDALEGRLAQATRDEEPVPRLIYEIPDFHNPTGSVMAEDRREKLVDLATRYEIPILEDNPYRWLRYEGSPARPLKSFDKKGIVITAGTFAKILGPGLRIGWLHVRRDLLERIAALKADGGTSPLTQMLAYEFFREDGSLDRHVSKVKTLLRQKRDAMLESLETNLAGRATWTRPAGGYYLWASLQGGLSSDDLLREVADAGVAYYQGSMFYTSDDPPRGELRLAFSYETPDRIREGIAALGRVVARHAVPAGAPAA